MSMNAFARTLEPCSRVMVSRSAHHTAPWLREGSRLEFVGEDEDSAGPIFRKDLLISIGAIRLSLG